MTLLAAFQMLLYRYSGQEDVLVGSPIAGRNRTEVEGLIGYFVNMLVLRADLSGNPTFRELLRRVREVALAAYAYQDLPFERLVEELHPERNLSYNPLFQISLALEYIPAAPASIGSLETTIEPISAGTSIFDLSVEIIAGPQGLQAAAQYSTDLFDREMIQRLLTHFQVLLEGIASNPDHRLADLPLLTTAERMQLLGSWSGVETAYPRDRSIKTLFEEQVARDPEAVAVEYQGHQLTYAELNARSNQLAHYLRSLGVGPEVMVGLCVERSLEMVVGTLGIVKAGAPTCRWTRRIRPGGWRSCSRTRARRWC
jgi:non-ribosomal peptide synthetase component F